ncbi:MAG: thioredoxin family protein [Bacteroidales bacterium]|nr:thioredoxin family protein [Bacteroidales bacterium]
MFSSAAFGQIQNPAHWSFKVKELSAQQVELQFVLKLDDGWHIYSQKSDANGPIPMEYTFDENAAYKRVGGVVEPKPHEEMDDVFNCMVRSFSGKATFRQKIDRKTADAFTVTGSMYYQLCNDGSCIAPDDTPFSFKVPAATMTDSLAEPVAETEETVNEDTASVVAVAPIAEEEPLEEEEHSSLLYIFLMALLGGILTMFTPCVFPMIPMTVNYFMHSSANRRKNTIQALFFGFSIIFIFTVVGALLSLVFGPESLNTIGTNGYVNVVFFLIFFTFALSFFGLFEITMPEKWINGSDSQAEKGGFLAPFFIALTTVLISFSCTGPIIGGALVNFATSTTNRWVGLVSMLGFGIGFALPFTLLAFFPQVLKNMKSGGWLNSVKIVFAFLELVFGLKFLSIADQYWSWGLLDRDIYLAIWIVLFGLMGLYLMGKIKFKGDTEVEHIGVVRLFFIICSFTVMVMLIPGLWGAPLKGLSGFLPPMDTQDFNIERSIIENSKSPINVNAVVYGDDAAVQVSSSLPANRKYADKLHMPTGFEGFYDLDEAKAYARSVNKPIFIDFTGRNCANCREMEEYVWVVPEAKTLLNNEFVMCALYADMNAIKLPESEWVTDDNGRTIKTLGRRNLYYQTKNFNMNAQPYYVIIDADGNVLTKNNFKYTRDAEKFVAFLQEGVDNFKK